MIWSVRTLILITSTPRVTSLSVHDSFGTKGWTLSVHDDFGTKGWTLSVHDDFGTYEIHFGTCFLLYDFGT